MLSGRRVLAALSLLLLTAGIATAQRELVPVDHPVYRFLFRQELRGAIEGFNWGMLPLSRAEIAGYLDTLEASAVRVPVKSMSHVDLEMLDDFRTEFSYDLTRSAAKSSSFLPGFDFPTLFNDSRQKYLYARTDSSTSIFIDGFASLSYRSGSGDSVGSALATLGDIGIRVRGTLFDRLGYYVQASNGSLLSGSHDFAILDPHLKANRKFNSDEKKFFDRTVGYLRYDADWLVVTLGREQLLWGMGYADRAVLSENSVPFDFAKIDIKKNSVRYSFFHGSLVGQDSAGENLSSKYIAAHRLEFDIVPTLRIGLSEMVIYSNQPMNFALMNPFTFLTSAELSTEMPTKQDNRHNTLLAIDAELYPSRNVRLFGSWLIDDIKIGAIGKSDISANSNKFGWQAGCSWTEAFSVPNLTLNAEYSRIGPFVTSHWTNASSYTNWSLPLSEALQPNSDEWLFSAGYDITNRLFVSGQVKLQQSGENIVDSEGHIVFDAGSDILHGEGHLLHPNLFLQGRRVDRTLASFLVSYQPIRQYFVELKYFFNNERFIESGRSLVDSVVWLTVRVDY